MYHLLHIQCSIMYAYTVCLVILFIMGYMYFLQPDSGHYYGFAYFRQVKDADIKRGYFQKVNFMQCGYCIDFNVSKKLIT